MLAAGAGTLAALAGCVGGIGGSTGDGGDEEPTPTTGTPSPTTGGEETLAGHPAARDLAAQPTLGPVPTEAAGVVVAFEDPSCPLCRRFERDTYPKLRSELVDPGEVALVWRTYPVVYPWGMPASQALESAYAADEAAFWALKDHYFATQSAFDEENVLDRTETFLASETSVDAAAVVEDAREERHGAAVRADLQAGRDAGAGSQTPKFFLFRDGQFRTLVSGPQGYDVFAAALGF